MQLHFAKQLYSKEALIKTAFAFTDKAYIQLHQDSDSYIIEAHKKESSLISDDQLSGEIGNEMLAQIVRQVIYGQTRRIRELVLARALASTVVGKDDNLCALESDHASLDGILADWFERSER